MTTGMSENRFLLPVLLSAAFMGWFLAGCAQNNEQQAVPGRLFRLIDHFEEIEFGETTTGITENAIQDTRLAAFIDENLNRDEIRGSSTHPYKLKVTKSSPSDFTTGLRTENVILAPAPTTFAISKRLAAPSSLSFGYGVLAHEGEYPEGDFTFEINVENSDGSTRQQLFTRTLSPAEKPRHRRWIHERIELEDFNNQGSKLVFRTSVSGKTGDGLPLSAWINPTIVQEEGKAQGLNIILISLDTLRADHLGCYGYHRDTSPSLDRLAGEGVLFQKAVSQAPYTLSSHMSLLTSLYPSFHKVNKPKESYLNPEITTLAEILYNQGYRTWAAAGGGQISPTYGFADGFETYIAYSSLQRDVNMKVRETIRFLDEEKENHFFIFLHSYQTHTPYTPPPPYDEMFGSEYHGPIDGEIETIEAINKGSIEVGRPDLDRIVSLYDGEIREADDSLAELFDYLEREGLAPRTLVVFTSDHGEEFGEHGKVGTHSRTLHDEVIRIPLIFKLPGTVIEGRIIEEQVQSVDIVPTILELAGVNHRYGLQGTSLAKWLTGESETMTPTEAFAERLTADGNILRSVRDNRFKYIFRDNRNTGESEHFYFDLEKDPREQESLPLSPDQTKELYGKLRFLIEEEETNRSMERSRRVDEKTLDALRKLGYVK
jgi:arylsulfatase A-like enzyme